MTKKEIKVSDYLANRLSKESRYVFAGNGSSILHVLQSFSKIRNMKIIPCQNEQGSSIAADAYSRISNNKIGVVVTTSGPGTLNTFQGIASSYYDSISAIYISGAPVTDHIRKKNSKLRQLGFQEMDMVKITKSFTKYSTRIEKPSDIVKELEKCIQISKSNRPGPCLIEIPDDIQRSYFLKKKIKLSQNKELNKKNEYKNILKKFNKYLNNSKKPLVIIGYGARISNAEKIIINFCKKNQIPFTLTWPVADLANDNDKLFCGSFGAYATQYGNKSVQSADLLIIVGCRLNPTHIGGNPKLFNPNAKKIKIDIDPNEMSQENGILIDCKIQTDCKIFFQQLIQYKKISKNKNWISEVNFYKKNHPVIRGINYKDKIHVDPYVFFKYLSKKITKKSTIINDTSCNMVWMHQSFQFKKNQRVYSAYNHSPMGYSVAASLGFYLGDKKNDIISIIGDGGIQMNIQELQSIKHFGVPVKIFLFNNNSLGMVKQAMDTWFNKKYVACNPASDLTFPDFSKIANSYGIKYTEINNNYEIKKKLNYIFKKKQTIICNIKINPDKKMSPKVKLGSPIEEMEYLD